MNFPMTSLSKVLKIKLRKMTNPFDNSQKQLAVEIYSPSVTTRLNEDEHEPKNLSNTSLRQDDFAHSTPFTATVVSDTIRKNSRFHTQEHSFRNFNLRLKFNFSGESESVVSPPIFSQGNRVPTQLTPVNDLSRQVTTTQKSQQNTQSPL